MKILNKDEIKIMAENLCMDEQEAQDVADLFVMIKHIDKNNYRVKNSLDNVDEYIDEWECHWHREMSWKDAYEYDKGCIGDCLENLNINSLEEYILYMKNRTHYELPHSNLIAIVC